MSGKHAKKKASRKAAEQPAAEGAVAKKAKQKVVDNKKDLRDMYLELMSSTPKGQTALSNPHHYKLLHELCVKYRPCPTTAGSDPRISQLQNEVRDMHRMQRRDSKRIRELADHTKYVFKEKDRENETAGMTPGGPSTSTNSMDMS